MNNIKMFEGHEVEVFELNGRVLFNSKHVGKCLDLSESAVRNYLAQMNQKQAIIVKNSDVRDKDIRKLNNAGEKFLTESGVYKLVFKSRKPSAERFSDWVTDEVLPSIRKHGAYMTQETLKKALTSPDFLIQLATKLKEEQKARKQAEFKLEEQEPLVAFANKVSDSSNLIDMGKLAKLLNDEHIKIGRNKFFQWLREQKILMKNNIPYQRYIDSGYFQIKESTFKTPYGEKTAQTTYVTGKGQIYITEKLRKCYSY